MVLIWSTRLRSHAHCFSDMAIPFAPPDGPAAPWELPLPIITVPGPLIVTRIVVLGFSLGDATGVARAIIWMISSIVLFLRYFPRFRPPGLAYATTYGLPLPV